jgi:hypothetical protein
MITEHDRVVLTAPVPEERLEIGDVGTVVHVYHDRKAFEVEFTALDGTGGWLKCPETNSSSIPRRSICNRE